MTSTRPAGRLHELCKDLRVAQMPGAVQIRARARSCFSTAGARNKIRDDRHRWSLRIDNGRRANPGAIFRAAGSKWVTIQQRHWQGRGKACAF
jgi:hypothetical protein